MKLAVINSITNIVENVIVPPEGAQVWFVPDGFIAVRSLEAAIGDTWNGTEFIKPIQPEPTPE